VGERLNRVALLGSTGSIGTQTLSVVRALRGRVEMVALAGGRNARTLSSQLSEFRPRLYYALDPGAVDSCGATMASLEEIASDDGVDTVVVATSGRAGLAPTLAALRHGKKVALASKEVLVMAGHLVMEAARCVGASLVPIDSEHSAVWQCLQGENGEISRLMLTASGGPFRDYTQEMLSQVTATEALSHPVWSMGAKITIDSATLMNKGLELIEAHWLFGVLLERIEVLVHPECIVHSMVEFVDGSVKAQLGVPDMSMPIQYALTHPDRLPGLAGRLRWDSLRTLSFRPVDEVKFRCLGLARGAISAGSTYPAALCGADEAAVALFLRGAIQFTDIAPLVESALSSHCPSEAKDIDAVVAAYEGAHEYVLERPAAYSRHSECRTEQV
jgi:1-deoxy-D-xylulose-5-phosphate reductoisomerase